MSYLIAKILIIHLYMRPNLPVTFRIQIETSTKMYKSVVVCLLSTGRASDQ